MLPDGIRLGTEFLLRLPNLAADPIVQELICEGLRVSRAAYLEMAGLPKRPRPEIEAQLPDGIRKGTVHLLRRTARKNS